MTSAPDPGKAPSRVQPADDHGPLMNRFHGAITASIKADLSLRQMAVLLILGTEAGQHTVRGLAHRLRVPRPSITRAIDVLEQRHGWARRMHDPSDGRSVLLALTATGRRQVSRVRARLRQDGVPEPEPRRSGRSAAQAQMGSPAP